ncbi:hypothetical protein LCGC14_0310740 [marine sediment metagenome]|uniref:Uncharacterized protein n=1 Tax=marine sediment metagenome TaxID=412755 RepID=A0A0F9W9C8_9ZZZZ
MVQPRNQDEQTESPITEVTLFESSHMGFGDATEVKEHRYHRIHGSIDPRWVGQVRMGLQVRSIATTNLPHTPIFALEWTDTDTISPAIFYIAGAQYHKILFGADTNIQAGGVDLLISGAGASASALATGATFDDDGSGVAYVYVGFGGGASAQVIRRINVAQAITLVADTTIQARLLLSLHGRLYRTFTASGGSANASVSVCPLGADRMDATLWSAGTVVGYAGTNINALIALGNAPIAIKPEGIFAYNESRLRWTNRTPAWWRYPHARNGIGAFSLGNVLVIPMGDGGAVTFDGVNTQPFDPHETESTPNLHTTTSFFATMGSLRHEIVGATAVNTASFANAKMISAGSDLRVFSFDASGPTFTDHSTNVRDGSLTTTASFTIDQTTDFLYIGWVRPFIGVQIAFSTLNSTARTMTVEVSDGSTGWNTIAVRDFTAQPVGTPWGQTGNIIMTADPVATQSWLTDTVNSVSGLYWIRISFSGTLSNDPVIIFSIQIQPWSPSIDNTNYPLDGLDRSGAFPHLLLGRRGGGGQSIWHDIATIPEPDDIGAVIYGNVGGTNLNRFRNLLAIGRFAVWRIDITPDEHPGTMSHPFLNDVGLMEFPAFVPNEGHLSRLKSVTLFGLDSDPNLLGRFYYTWDVGEPWNMSPLKVLRFPAVTEIRQPQRGYSFRWAFGWTQAAIAARATQPALVSAKAEFEKLPDRVDTDQERVMATQPRF